jgi:curved DNA-binding protein CbpA
MAAVNRAYEVLANPLLRARYDNTGQDVPLPSIEREAQDMLLQVFRKVLDEEGSTDILGQVRSIVADASRQIASNESKQIAAKGRLIKLSGRVRSKGAQNLVQMLIDQQLTQIAAQLDNLARAKEVHAKVSEMLATYDQDEELSRRPVEHRPVMFSQLPTGWR